MPVIEVVDFNGELVERREFAADKTFWDVAHTEWPTGFVGYTPVILDPKGDTVVDVDVINELMQDGDVWTIQLMPQGPVFLGLNMLQWALLAVSLAASYLMAPKLPNAQSGNYEWDDSNRPQFYSGQQNQVNPGSRITDVFGRIRVYPDLLSPPAVEYYGNNQTIRELYVISRGTVEVESPKFHDEDYNDVPGTSYRLYKPGQQWPMDFPIMRVNNAVGNIELPASNEAINYGFTYSLSGNGWIWVEKDGYWDEFVGTVGSKFTMTGVNAVNRTPRTVTGVSSNGRYLYVSPPFAKNETISGGTVTFRGIDYVSETSTGVPRVYDIKSWVFQGDLNVLYMYYRSDVKAQPPYTYNGTLMEIGGWNDLKSSMIGAYPSNGFMYFKWIGETSATKPTGQYYYVTFANDGAIYVPNIPGSGYASAVFNVPGISSEAWLDFEFSSGLYTQVSGNAPQAKKVRVRVWYRLQNSTGAFASKDIVFTDKTRTPRRFTMKVKLPSNDRWELYVERITDMTLETSTRVTVDAVRWIGLSARQYTPELKNDILNCTIIDVTLRSQSLAQAGQNRRFNLIANRVLYDYRLGQWGTFNSVSAAMLHTLYSLGNVPRTNVDEASLFAIQDELDAQGPNDGKWHGSVNQTMTVEDQLMLMASVGRIMVYRRGSTFYFARNKAGMIPETLVNARNKTQPENRSFTFSERNDPDAVILRYQDETNDYKENTYQYPEGITPINAEEQTIMGATNPTVISRMARYVWNKRKYEKDTISVSMTEEGALLTVGSLISVTDFLTENPPIEGEVIKVNGTSFTFDEVIPAGTYMAAIRDRYGALYKPPHQVTYTGASSVRTVTNWDGITMPPENNGASVGLLYSFTEVQSQNKDEFYVTRVQPSREGPVAVDGILYRQETYAGDTATSFDVSPKRIDTDSNPPSSGGSWTEPWATQIGPTFNGGVRETSDD